jgi:hypothetical protein
MRGALSVLTVALLSLIELPKGLQDYARVQHYLSDGVLYNVVEKMFRDARHLLTPRQASIVKPAVTRISDVASAAAATTDETLQKIGVFLVAW